MEFAEQSRPEPKVIVAVATKALQNGVQAAREFMTGKVEVPPPHTAPPPAPLTNTSFPPPPAGTAAVAPGLPSSSRKAPSETLEEEEIDDEDDDDGKEEKEEGGSPAAPSSNTRNKRRKVEAHSGGGFPILEQNMRHWQEMCDRPAIINLDGGNLADDPVFKEKEWAPTISKYKLSAPLTITGGTWGLNGKFNEGWEGTGLFNCDLVEVYALNCTTARASSTLDAHVVEVYRGEEWCQTAPREEHKGGLHPHIP